jgi:hypothetical protein
MAREDWIAVRAQTTGAVLIDITRTPMARLATDASLVASYALKLSPVVSEVGIIRLDPEDAPNVYNVDKYTGCGRIYQASLASIGSSKPPRRKTARTSVSI